MPSEHGLLQLRYDTVANLDAQDPVIALGEPVLGTGPIPVLKVGDGVTHWTQLKPINVADLEHRLTADELNIDALIHRTDTNDERLNDLTQDTGWRDIKAYFDPTFSTKTNQDIFARRIGNIVTVELQGPLAKNGVSTVKLPAGHGLNRMARSTRDSPGDTSCRVYVENDVLVIYGFPTNDSSVGHGITTYVTTDPWPSPVPGTAAAPPAADVPAAAPPAPKRTRKKASG